jgi:hypothetical protein
VNPESVPANWSMMLSRLDRVMLHGAGIDPDAAPAKEPEPVTWESDGED